MKRGKWSAARVAAWVAVGVVFALGYDLVGLLPFWGARLPLSWAARLQDWSHPLRFGLVLAALAGPWWALTAVHGSPRKLPPGPSRRRALWIAWGGLAVVLLLLALPSLPLIP
ncbi:hypothetical protein [Deferrisoma palaeochoriense]